MTKKFADHHEKLYLVLRAYPAFGGKIWVYRQKIRVEGSDFFVLEKMSRTK